MANQLLVYPFPAGHDSTQTSLTVNGSIALCGAAVATGEPLNWSNIMTGIGYNEVNFLGNGAHGSGSALTTGFAISSGVCTVTAANNFTVGEPITFLGNTQTLSALFNGVVVTVASASSTQFTFATATTGTTTTGDVGVAVVYAPSKLPVPVGNTSLTATVTAISASGGIVTVTAANTFLPGAQVTFAGFASGTLGPKLIAAGPLTVASSTSTAFTIVSALTGTTGTGTATGINSYDPISVEFHSETASGYIYQYSGTTGVLFVMQVPASASLSSAAPMSALPAAAYPSGVLNDVVKFTAKFAKG
jgi:hypothetical protein